MEPKTDPHDLEEAKFASGVLERTEELMNAGEAEKLILVAAPKTLGEMRKSMPKALADRLTATLDKDLTRTPANELAKASGGRAGGIGATGFAYRVSRLYVTRFGLTLSAPRRRILSFS